MKKSMVFAVFAAMIALGLILPSVTATNGVQAAPNFTWQVQAGDEVIMFINTGFDMELPATVWAAVDAQLEAMELGITHTDILALIDAVLPSNLGVKLTIVNVTGELYTYESASFSDENKIDYVYATMSLSKDNGATWLTFNQYINATLDQILPTVVPVVIMMQFGGTLPEGVTEEQLTEMLKANMYESMKMEEDTAPFVISMWNLYTYTESDTEITRDGPGDLLADVPSPNGLPLVLPDEFKFSDIYNAFTTMADTQLANINTTWAALYPIFGVTQLQVNPRSVAVAFDLNEVDWDSVNDLLAVMGDPLGGPINLSDYEALVVPEVCKVAAGIEYNSKGILSALGMYVDMEMWVDYDMAVNFALMMSGMGPVREMMDFGLGNGTMSLGISQTVAIQGVTPPTADQIGSGVIGDDRPGAVPTETNTDDGGMKIPGYPVGIIGAAGVFAAAALIIYKKRQL